MARRLIPLLLLILVITGCDNDPLMHSDDALPGSVGDLSGAYVLNGIDPYGKEYTGRLDITAGQFSDTYEIHWIVTEAFQEGTGTLRGNSLEVEWETTAQTALPVHGTAQFTVTTDGELYGSKSVDGEDGEWRETAYPINPDDI